MPTDRDPGLSSEDWAKDVGRRLRQMTVKLLAAFATAIFIFSACSTGDSDRPTSDIVSTIPWPAQEEATYRLLEDDEVIGSAILSTTVEGERLLMDFVFNFPDRGFRDEVAAVVDSKTLKPISVERVLSGPEGDRAWSVSYTSSSAVVLQKSEDDERTDTLALPVHAYDSWTDLLLWRTIDFKEGLEARYNDVATAIFRPARETVSLEVKELTQVEVPAGSFSAWRLNFRTNGPEHSAWYGTGEGRPLVRYDNGDLIFELEMLR